MSIKSHLKLPEMMACENKLHSNHPAADNFSKNIAELIRGLMVLPVAMVYKPPIIFPTEAAQCFIFRKAIAKIYGSVI